MSKKKEEKDLYSPTPPGKVLKEELRERGIKQKEFAARLEILPSHMSELINGTRTITDNIAMKLEEELGISASFWRNLQKNYTLDKKKYDLKCEEDKSAESEMAKLDTYYNIWYILKHTGMTENGTAERLDFCKNTMHLPEWISDSRYIGRFRKSEKTGLDQRAIASWAAIARYEAVQKKVYGIFNRNKIYELAEKLAVILHRNVDTVIMAEKTLSEYGIRFCIVEKIEKASIDGFSFISNGVPAIVMTKRFNRIDNFAFALLHELGHIKLHLTGNDMMNISFTGDSEEKEEQEADNFAMEMLIPKNVWKTTPQVKMTTFDIQRKFTAWAEEHNYNKWIVLGRVSHELGIYKFRKDGTQTIM